MKLRGLGPFVINDITSRRTIRPETLDNHKSSLLLMGLHEDQIYITKCPGTIKFFQRRPIPNLSITVKIFAHNTKKKPCASQFFTFCLELLASSNKGTNLRSVRPHQIRWWIFTWSHSRQHHHIHQRQHLHLVYQHAVASSWVLHSKTAQIISSCNIMK